jgi:hypothetical protein
MTFIHSVLDELPALSDADKKEETSMETTYTVTDETVTESTDTIVKADTTPLELFKKDPNVNLRQNDGVDSFGIYFEIDHDRYNVGEVTHTLRVLFIAGFPIVQYKSKAKRTGKWVQMKFPVPAGYAPVTDPSSDDQIKTAWDLTRGAISTYFASGKIIKRGEPMLVQLVATDVEAVKRRNDPPMIRYTAKSSYEKLYGKGV